LVVLLSLLACGPPDVIHIRTVGDGPADGGDGGAPSEQSSTESTDAPGAPGGWTMTAEGQVLVDDVAVTSGYVDEAFGELQRGRAVVPGDYDGDGDLDVFVGNPGDTSYLLMNETQGNTMSFQPGQVLGEETVMWGGASGDLDNDGDVDLVVSVGGNERGYPGYDQVFLNDGTGTLVEVADSGVVLTRPDGVAMESYGASAFLWDVDQDGLLDVFVNRPINPASATGQLMAGDPSGTNGLYMGLGDGTFVDEARLVGLGDQWSTRNSTPIDFDNDGDQDLYENNWVGPNRLWENQLAQTGEVSFVDVTSAMSLGGGDMQYPTIRASQASVAADLNQDGFDDLVVFRRGENEAGEPVVHAQGHMVWINVDGEGFVEVGDHTGANLDFSAYRSHGTVGVMGCQVGDLDADGLPDLFMGNGSPDGGEANHLMVSDGVRSVEIEGVGEVTVPVYTSWSSLIDVASDHDLERHGDGLSTYPYRSHGSAFADFDGDGLYELAIHNGGPTWADDLEMQEPNRLFRFRFAQARRWLRVELVGDGVEVPLDAIGTRVAALVIEASGAERWVYARRRSASGFGAQNGPDVFFGLDQASKVDHLVVDWPNGEQEIVPVGARDRRIRVEL